MEEYDWGLSFSVSSPLCVSVSTQAFCCDLISQLQHPAHSCQPHTWMHAHMHLHVKFKTSQYEALRTGSRNCSDITLSHNLMGCIFSYWKHKLCFWTLCSQNELVRWWEITSAAFHISWISLKSFKILRHTPIMLTHSFSHSQETLSSTNASQTLIKSFEILPHWLMLV